MTIDVFKDLIPKIEKTKLPGIDSQFKMAPIMRKKLGKDFDVNSKKPKQAAVMALLYPKKNEMTMVFMMRKTYQGVHSNQIGFPGGKLEKSDANLLEAAIRETEEEIGVTVLKSQVLKELTEVYIPPSNFLVKPYLGWATKELTFIPEEAEVERIIEIPLHLILSDQFVSSKELTTSYANKIEVPTFKFNNEVIWGATAMILSEIKDLLLQAS